MAPPSNEIDSWLSNLKTRVYPTNAVNAIIAYRSGFQRRCGVTVRHSHLRGWSRRLGLPTRLPQGMASDGAGDLRECLFPRPGNRPVPRVANVSPGVRTASTS
jgi:hypothetical protein